MNLELEGDDLYSFDELDSEDRELIRKSLEADLGISGEKAMSSDESEFDIDNAQNPEEQFIEEMRMKVKNKILLTSYEENMLNELYAKNTQLAAIKGKITKILHANEKLVKKLERAPATKKSRRTVSPAPAVFNRQGRQLFQEFRNKKVKQNL